MAVLVAIRGSRGELCLGPEGRPASQPLRRLDRLASPERNTDPARSIAQAGCKRLNARLLRRHLLTDSGAAPPKHARSRDAEDIAAGEQRLSDAAAAALAAAVAG